MQDWVLNRAFKTVPGVIDVTGYGGTVKQYQVLVDPMQLNQYGITLQQVEDAIQKSNANVGGDILTLGSQSHNVRAIGLLGKGIDPLDPANGRPARRDRSTTSSTTSATSSSPSTRAIRSSSATSPRSWKGISRGWGSWAGHGAEKENDVVEGIVLMRKYEKSLTVSEAVEEKIEEIERAEAPARGDEDRDLQPAHRPGPRHDAQRAAQPGGGHGAGDRDPVHLPGRPGQRGHRGAS